MSRRRFGHEIAALLGAGLGAGCEREPHTRAAPVLNARPHATQTTAAPGMRMLGAAGRRGGVLRVPANASRQRVPLLVWLHGAGGDGAGYVGWLDSLSDTSQIAVLAPDSIGQTWDAILLEQRDLFDVFGGTTRVRGFGPDVDALDRTLAEVFASIAVDPERVIAAGFSDGATYALSLGLANGDLFRRIIAFSPGFVVDVERRGQPAIFITHGREDGILPIDRCSRVIAPRLKAAGYPVTYREFGGGHELPAGLTQDALAWSMR